MSDSKATKIVDLKAGMRGLDIIGTIVRKAEPQMRGGKRYCRAIIDDGTAHIVLSLWRDQVDQVQVGDRVHVPQAFVRRWAREIQLNTWSALVVLESGKGKSD